MLARDFVGALQIAEEVKLQNRFKKSPEILIFSLCVSQGIDCFESVLLAPKEPSIYELLSRIYDQLGRKVKAITCGNLAVAYGKGIYGANADDLGAQDDTLLSNDYDNSSNFEGTNSFDQTPERLNFGMNSLSTPQEIGGGTNQLNFTPLPNNQLPSSQATGSEPQSLQLMQNPTIATNEYQVPSYLRDEVEQDVLTMEYN